MAQSVSEQVAERIHAYIRAQRLRPGDRLGRQVDLARQFGVSQPTVREALRILSPDCPIQAVSGPGGGFFLADDAERRTGLVRAATRLLEAHDVELGELVEARLVLEPPLAARAALRAEAPDVAVLERLLADLDCGPPGGAEADRRFHQRVADMSGSRIAAAVVGWLLELTEPRLGELIGPALVESVAARHHRHVGGAIAAGDARAAEASMREHLVYLVDLVNAVSEVRRAPEIMRPV
jgi:GntR family transcriptional repressor for pyruvate dehydrogenase complex